MIFPASPPSRRRVFSPVLASLVFATLLAACAVEGHRTLRTESVASYRTQYTGPRYAMVIGKFNNKSEYMRGLFSGGSDRLGNQARTILKTHLSQTGRFTLLDRDNMDEIAAEAALSGAEQNLTGAEVAVAGAVTEFGRRETGDIQLFGILGRGKKQLAYAKVSLNIVDVRTSQVVYSVQGAGEYDLSNREVVGFGGTAGYDSTLNGKVLNLAITDAVNKLVAAIEAGEWSPVKEP